MKMLWAFVERVGKIIFLDAIFREISIFFSHV